MPVLSCSETRGRSGCGFRWRSIRATAASSLRRHELQQMFDDAVGHFLLQIVAGRERPGVDEMACVFAP